MGPKWLASSLGCFSSMKMAACLHIEAYWGVMPCQDAQCKDCQWSAPSRKLRYYVCPAKMRRQNVNFVLLILSCGNTVTAAVPLSSCWPWNSNLEQGQQQQILYRYHSVKEIYPLVQVFSSFLHEEAVSRVQARFDDPLLQPWNQHSRFGRRKHISSTAEVNITQIDSMLLLKCPYY